MAQRTKRRQAIRELCPQGKVYTLSEALSVLKQLPPLKFTEAVEVAACLGVDAKKSDQNVRGAVEMPHGLGKTVRVVVFAQGAAADAALEAGADRVGFEDLAQAIQDGFMDFDVVIAAPDAMRVVGPLGQILGPRGLMPNPKVGTVTPDVVSAVKKSKSGQVRYKTDKGGVVHAAVGQVSFSVEALQDNIVALLDALQKGRPQAAKGTYFKKIALSTTMGPGLAVDLSSVPLSRSKTMS